MFTRCPACHTVHPVSAALLAADGGRYRCGKCQKTCNALESLFDQWPAAAEQAPGPAPTPTLGLSIDLEQAARARQAPEGSGLDTGGEDAEPRSRGPWLRLAWIAAAIVLAGVIAWEVAEFHGTPLPQRPEIERLLVRLGLREAPPPPVFRDLDRIHLVSRELRTHPVAPGRLVLKATIVNRAARKQPYPDLEVTLLDAAGQALSSQRFTPRDYLAAGADRSAGMAPQAYLPLTLELDDPGERAVGFELKFD